MADRTAPERTGRLKVPGATLYYEVRGEGPLLLLMPGGSADAGLYDRMAARLADRWTVAAFDPRGYSRSLLDGALADQQVAVQSEDAYRLIELLSPDDGPVAVFGSSSSAIVALDLLSRHPERLHRVVAHEPPLVELLPDPERGRKLFAAVRDSFRRDGEAAALATMTEGLTDPEAVPPAGGGHRAAAEPSAREAEAFRRMRANLPVFLEHVLCSFSGYVPDLAALERATEKLVIGVGEDSRTLLTAIPGVRLTDRAIGGLVEFPGGHTGCVEDPDAFAARLRAVLLDETHRGA
ncbi:alpha/beta hydrolase [Streptomyces sp. NBC_01591]|uniref:alpha/beta fold hydrolase n=1 Tax=Streptomyces sp. NBC_01591 TaxID=2975888 RepID=UPI002DD7A2BB|nr:alpha/beta hydrolase [Streptomyces sp. NBC_01591]WSD72603.1 alpha/beta hydrolase [Streptomyces sp. NBC_01591]